MTSEPATLTAWQLAKTQAHVALARFSAVLDLVRPSQGLFHCRAADRTFEDAQLLRVNFAGGESCEASELEDAYQRGGDLVATYTQTDARPFRTQVYWRTHSHPLSAALAVIELVTSVQTSLLDSRPELTTGSRVPATEAFHLLDARVAQYDPLILAVNCPTYFARTRPCCFVCRLDGDVSYAQMVHPLDARETSIVLTKREDDDALTLDLQHQLFAQQLEKGVILRSRVLGVLLPRTDHLATAAHHYLAFAATEPPLTT